MTLQTRKPTRRAGWPRILVEGGDKAGKSWALAKLSASPKVGRTVVLVLGEDESRWDEYGLISGARFEIAQHDGTWKSIMATVEDAKAEAEKARDAGEPPFVFGFDTVTAEWDGLKDWASLRARGSKKNKALLAQDPDAEIDVTSNYWNDAKQRHRALMRILLTFPGIVVLIARGSEVTLFQNGQPVANRKTWSVEGEKNLPYDVSTHIRLSRDSRPLLVAAAGVHCQIRPGIDPPHRLPDDWSLEGIIFDTLKVDAATATAGGFTEFTQDRTPEDIRDEALRTVTTTERIRELYRDAATARMLAVEVQNETGANEELGKLLQRLGKERAITPAQDQAAAGSGRDEAAQADKASAPDGQGWLDDAIARASAATDVAACRALWAESARKVREAACTREETQQVQDILRAQIEDLGRAASAAALDPEDPWAAKVDGLTSDEEAAAALAELTELSSSIDATRALRIRNAILATFPGAESEAEAAA